MKNCSRQSYDIIIVDSTDPVGPAEGLFTKEFYEDVYQCLKLNGIMVTQSESPRFNEMVFKEIQKCYQEIFGENNVHPYLAYIPTYPSGMWSFSFCAKDIHPIDDFHKKEAEALMKEHKLNYYTPSIHESAFILPGFVQKLISNQKIIKSQ